MWGQLFCQENGGTPPHAGQQKSPASKHSRTEDEKTARPLASPCLSRSHQQLANTGTQLSKPDRRQARRAARPFSQSGSRTFVQSGNCSAAASQSTVPFRLASFLLQYLSVWLVWQYNTTTPLGCQALFQIILVGIIKKIKTKHIYKCASLYYLIGLYNFLLT